jgi:hypothetical protein
MIAGLVSEQAYNSVACAKSPDRVREHAARNALQVFLWQLSRVGNPVSAPIAGARHGRAAAEDTWHGVRR